MKTFFWILAVLAIVVGLLAAIGSYFHRHDEPNNAGGTIMAGIMMTGIGSFGVWLLLSAPH